METHYFPLHANTVLIIGMVATLLLPLPIHAQPGAQTGQNIQPAYEGYIENPDGSFDLLFGYLNRNWAEAIDVPLGPNNHIEPGGPDQGQPTYFFPRRNRFVFRIRVPADFGENEVVWTLTTHGKTARAYGTLRPGYAVDDTVLMANFGGGGAGGFHPDTIGNRPPKLMVDGQKTRSVSAGEPVTLIAVATDDGKPGKRVVSASGLLGRSRSTPQAATGLRLSWFRYRGSGEVRFTPNQTKVWEDFRDGGSSPWSAGWEPPPIPPANRWVVQATFSEPGTYVLRCLAHDGGLQTYEDITFHVDR
jgi:hypothetical protein